MEDRDYIISLLEEKCSIQDQLIKKLEDEVELYKKHYELSNKISEIYEEIVKTITT